MPTLLPLLVRYPWAFVGPILVLNAVYGYRRAGPLVAAGRISEAERRRFAVGAAAGVLGFALVMTGIQYASGYPVFTCLLLFPLRSRWGAAFWGVQFLAMAALLWWLWWGHGADTLARVGPAYSRRPVLDVQYTPGRVRALLTALILIATLGLPIQMAIVRHLEMAGAARVCASKESS